jgi:hypothetical protein
MPNLFHTVVYPGEDVNQAITRASLDATRNGFTGYCIDCEKCGQPVDRHEAASDCAVWLKHFGGNLVVRNDGQWGRVLPDWDVAK